MQILWIKSDYVDPPDTGGKIRTFNLLRELHRHCRVTYVSLQSEGGPIQDTVPHEWASQVVTFPYTEEKKSGLRFSLRILAAMFSSVPYIVQKYRSAKIQDYQKQLAASPSGSRPEEDEIILICDFLEMAGNVAWSVPGPKILFQHNVESVIWQRYYENETHWLKKAYFWFEHRRMSRYERNTCNRFDLVLAVSQIDKDVLQRRLGVSVPIEVIETGVDVDHYSPRPDVEPVPGRLLFLGSLDWMPNIDGIEWFVREVYPTVKQLNPQVTLDVVGRRPTPTIQAIASTDSSINVYGSVPDVRPYMAAAALFIVPLRIGSGTRLKIFEAMAMRCPVVSTTVGAEGLSLEPGHHLKLADSASEFAETIHSLLANPSEKKLAASNGYEHVTRNYSWQRVSKTLHEACLNIQRQVRTRTRSK